MSVPFSVEDVYTGFADMQGVARLDQNSLVLEFQIKDSVFGIIKSEPKEVQIPFGELAEAAFKRGWVGGKLTLRARRMIVLSGIPGTNGAELRLKFQRRHRDAAQELASSLNMRMISQDLQRMADDTARRPSPPAGSA